MSTRRLAPAGIFAMVTATLLLGCTAPNPLYDPDPQLAPASPSVADPGGAVAQPDPPAPPSLPAASSDASASPPDTGPPAITPTPPAPAGKLCDPCNPYHPEQCADPHGMCVVNVDTHESFCTTACNDTTPCPSGYKCLKVKSLKSNSTATQCVPISLSCTH